MEKYEALEIEVIVFESNDVIVTSTGDINTDPAGIPDEEEDE